MLLARLIRQFARLRRLQPKIGRVHATILKRSRGRLRRSLLLAGGQPVLALTTTGRRSGKARATTVAYVKHGDAFAVTPLNLGSDRHPNWWLNLQARPNATIHVRGDDLHVRAREATGTESDELWARFTRQFPQIKNTRRIAQRHVPMIVLDPGTPQPATPSN
jgi:deazaflavin-dependent oxidoreductase (nitroreductase family)